MLANLRTASSGPAKRKPPTFNACAFFGGRGRTESGPARLKVPLQPENQPHVYNEPPPVKKKPTQKCNPPIRLVKARAAFILHDKAFFAELRSRGRESIAPTPIKKG